MFCRSENCAVIHGQSDQSPQFRFGLVQLIQRQFQVGFRFIKSIQRLRFFALNPCPDIIFVLQQPPRPESAFVRRRAGVEQAIREIKIPVGIFYVAHRRTHSGFKIGQRNILIDACDCHALTHPCDRSECRIRWPRDPREFDTAACQQGLIDLRAEYSLIDRRIVVARS